MSKRKCQSCVSRCMDKQSPALEVKQCVPDLGNLVRTFPPPRKRPPRGALQQKLVRPEQRGVLFIPQLGRRFCQLRRPHRERHCTYASRAGTCTWAGRKRALTMSKRKCQSCVSRCMDKQSPALEVKQCVPDLGNLVRTFPPPRKRPPRGALQQKLVRPEQRGVLFIPQLGRG